MRWKQVAYSLVSIYCDSPQLAIQKNKLYKTLDYWPRDMPNFIFFRKGSGISFSTTFCAWFFKKNLSPVAFLWLTKFHCLIACTSRDTGKYVYYNCLLTKLDVIIFEINLIFLIKPFWYKTKKSRQKLKYLENGKSFWAKIKSIFRHF